MFFDSSKNRDTWCDNICVDVSTCVKDDESNFSKKLSQSQKKKSGSSWIELYIEFKSNVNDDPFRDDERTNCSQRMHLFTTPTNQSVLWGRLVPIQQLWSEYSSAHICFQY